MENNAHKEIKVYGTLLNQTINTNPNGTQSDLVDNAHNDYLTVAYQLYDERFSPKKGSGANFAVTAIDRYQDIINKRLTAIYFDDQNTQDGGDDITYIDSKVNISGDTNIEKNLTVEGDATFEGDINITGDINLDMGLNDLNDVTLSTMAIGQVLRYDGSKWVNAKLSLSDIQMPAASNGQVLKFNGTEWVAGTDETGSGTTGDEFEYLEVDMTNNITQSTTSASQYSIYNMTTENLNRVITALVYTDFTTAEGNRIVRVHENMEYTEDTAESNVDGSFIIPAGWKYYRFAGATYHSIKFKFLMKKQQSNA